MTNDGARAERRSGSKLFSPVSAAVVRITRYIGNLRPLYSFQSSVRKGEAGKPSALYKLAPAGLLAHAYRTATG